MTIDSRKGYLAALAATINFVESVPRLQSAALSLPLAQLAAAISDLDHGIVVPALRRADGFNNRKNDPTLLKQVKALSAATVSQLVKTNLSVENSCREVAKVLRRAGLKIESKVVKGWRERMSKLDDTDEMKNAYFEMMLEYESAKAAPPELNQKKILEAFALDLELLPPLE